MAKVTLLSYTKDPIETLYKVWVLSKSNKPLRDIESEYTREKGSELAKQLMDADVPVVQNITFVFALEDVSVSFREQLVRQKIGVKFGDRVGIDTVPDLADAAFWCQSMRILSMGKFATEKKYIIPDSILNHGEPEFLRRYVSLMRQIQDDYNYFVYGGVPMQDAREVIPLAATHRITWTLNIASLLHVIGRRSCWILQGSYWVEIIMGLVKELREKVDSIFGNLASPLCIKDDKYHECTVAIDNERRSAGQDSLPCCPLWEFGQSEDGLDVLNSSRNSPKLVKLYSEFWQRDPMTGERL